ncbi:phosphoribosylamine--glycine ligase [Nanoarchaeota archaeon]
MAKVMILGSGGREHALAWWFRNYDHEVFSVPGNAGTRQEGANLGSSLKDLEAIIGIATDVRPDLVVPGPEAPLCAGIYDTFHYKGLPGQGINILGPSKAGAVLEGSKITSRKFAERYCIPIPDFIAYDCDDHETNVQQAKEFINSKDRPVVIKADGLASGKGVYVCDDSKEALEGLEKMQEFGIAGTKFLLEERLTGEEASITILTDGTSYKMFPHSQDHKRRFDGDEGPNTGGMGAYAPTRLITPEILSDIEENIIMPSLQGIREENWDYKGVLYIAIMVQDNRPYVIEYNCRFGDPETQTIIPLVDTDPFVLMMDCINGDLDSSPFSIKNDHYACCVVLADKNYPEGSSKGEELTMDPEFDRKDNLTFFHAGTRMEDGKIVTNGGRIGGVTAVSDFSPQSAIASAYDGVQLVHFNGKDFRKDIGGRVFH